MWISNNETKYIIIINEITTYDIFHFFIIWNFIYLFIIFLSCLNNGLNLTNIDMQNIQNVEFLFFFFFLKQLSHIMWYKSYWKLHFSIIIYHLYMKSTRSKQQRNQHISDRRERKKKISKNINHYRLLCTLSKNMNRQLQH